MMALVSGNAICESADADLVIIGFAAAQPDSFAEMAEEIDIRLAHEFELLGQFIQPALAEIAVSAVIILVKARQRALVVACKTQRAIGKDALGVNQMSDNFLD